MGSKVGEVTDPRGRGQTAQGGLEDPRDEVLEMLLPVRSIDPVSTPHGALHLAQEGLGVSLAGEGGRALTTDRVAIASLPVPGPWCSAN